jgi:ribonuclease E
MTRKKLGLGLLETFSEPCEACAGRGIIVHHDPVTKHRQQQQSPQPEQNSSRRGRGKANANGGPSGASQGQSAGTASAKGGAHTGTHAITEDVRHALAQIAASTVANTPSTSVESDADQSLSESPEIAPQGARRASRGGARRSSSSHATSDLTKNNLAANDEATRVPEVDSVEILDIPVVKARRASRRVSNQDAEVILDSVLDALPEPKEPGQGRARVSRRASSAGAAVTPVRIEELTGAQQDAPTSDG